MKLYELCIIEERFGEISLDKKRYFKTRELLFEWLEKFKEATTSWSRIPTFYRVEEIDVEDLV